ncbi:putative transcription factor RfeG [Thermoascus aurantiacus ATCC 26904]
MIADLKADSARWEADLARRANQGYSRDSYVQDLNPNPPPVTYASSAIHDVRQPPGPSPPTYPAAPARPYLDPYGQPVPYGAPPNPYPAPSYPSTGPPYGSAPNAYPPPQNPYTGPSQPPVSAPDMHPTYTYTSNAGYGYDNGRNNAPRYPGPGYENDPEYPPVTSGIAYPPTTAPDPRIGMDPRYAEPAYADRSRPQPAREREAPRRPR